MNINRWACVNIDDRHQDGLLLAAVLTKIELLNLYNRFGGQGMGCSEFQEEFPLLFSISLDHRQQQQAHDPLWVLTGATGLRDLQPE